MKCKCGETMKYQKVEGKPAYVCQKCGTWCAMEWHKPEKKPYPTSGIEWRDMLRVGCIAIPLLLLLIAVIGNFPK